MPGVRPSGEGPVSECSLTTYFVQSRGQIMKTLSDSALGRTACIALFLCFAIAGGVLGHRLGPVDLTGEFLGIRSEGELPAWIPAAFACFIAGGIGMLLAGAIASIPLLPLPCYLNHNWDGCRCRRRRCTATRDEGHVWDGCHCRSCPATRDIDHALVACQCQQCGRTIHDWRDGYCRSCGACRTCSGTGTMQCNCRGGEIPGWNDWDTMTSMFAGPTTTQCGTCSGTGQLTCRRCLGTGRDNSESSIASSCYRCLGKGFLENYDGEPPHYYTKVQCQECSPHA